MSNQRSFNYQFNDELNELNYFVNKTNFYAFNGLINNNLPCIFLHGPKKSGKTYLSQIWLKKNNAFEIKINDISCDRCSYRRTASTIINYNRYYNFRAFKWSKTYKKSMVL